MDLAVDNTLSHDVLLLVDGGGESLSAFEFAKSQLEMEFSMPRAFGYWAAFASSPGM